VCAVTGELVDRDVNAAQNLRDWPDHASCGSVGATAPFVLGPSRDGTGDGSDARTTGHPGSGCKTSASARAVRGEARTEPSNGGGTPRGVPQPWAYWSSRSGNGHAGVQSRAPLDIGSDHSRRCPRTGRGRGGQEVYG
jgi:hypothetical protein